MEIRKRGPGDNASRTEGRGNAVFAGKLVEASNDIGNHVGNHEFGKAFEW